MKREIKIAMAGLAHSHGTGFLKKALTYEGVSVVGFYDNDNIENARAASDAFGAPEYIIKALDAGLGVVADKPMATRLEDLDKIEAAAKKSGAPLYLMLTERFDSAVYTAKKLIDRGDIGFIAQQYLVRPHRLRPEGRPAWMFRSEQYGGILNDIGVHDIDLARFFSGSEVKRVLASYASNARFPQYADFCDNGMTLFEMCDGSSATVAVNWLTPDMYRAH